MRIKKIVAGELQVNCYLVWNAGEESSDEAILIDPGAEGERIIDIIKQERLKIVYIINTHGHPDHTGANEFIREKTHAPLFIHSADKSAITGKDIKLLENGDKIETGSLAFQVLHTPGHTPGSICLYGENTLFTGDTLFAGEIGRTDLPGGDAGALADSLDKIYSLKKNPTVYPGHGPSSTLDREKIKSGRGENRRL